MRPGWYRAHLSQVTSQVGVGLKLRRGSETGGNWKQKEISSPITAPSEISGINIKERQSFFKPQLMAKFICFIRSFPYCSRSPPFSLLSPLTSSDIHSAHSQWTLILQRMPTALGRKRVFSPGKTPAQLLFCSSRGHHVLIPLLPSTLAESASTHTSSPSPGLQAVAGEPPMDFSCLW